MPSEIMDQRRLSFFSEEIRCPTERQIGFCKPESVPDHPGAEGMSIPGSKSFSSSPLEKLRSTGISPLECLGIPHPYLFKDPKTKFSLDHHLMGHESIAGKSMTSWKAIGNSRAQSDRSAQPAIQCMDENNRAPYENGFMSSSLSEIFNKNLRLSSNDHWDNAKVVDLKLGEDEPFESLEEIEAQTIGNLLPDDDDLLSGVIDDLDYINRPNSGDDFEDDIFYPGGGMELEADGKSSCNGTTDFASGRNSAGKQGGLNSAYTAQYSYGEHPSRTLFVRNVDSNVEDSELKDLFEQYGDVHALYTAGKYRGFVMVSYYDMRAARNAIRALQNKLLRHRKLDIHFSVPKDNPSEKEINQGTLAVFILDSSVTNNDLSKIFGVYGEIKEIHESPHKRNYKFIEFYDVRAAEAALCALKWSDVAGKKIKIEPGHTGGAIQCALNSLMQPLYPEPGEEKINGYQQDSPPNNSPSEIHGTISTGAIGSSGLDNGTTLGLRSAVHAPVTTFMETGFHEISSGPHCLSSPVRVASVGNQCDPSAHDNHSHSVGQMSFGFPALPTFSPHSLPDYHDGLPNGVSFNSPRNMSAMPININHIHSEGIDHRHIHRLVSGGLNGHSFGHNGAAFRSLENGSCPLHGHQLYMSNSSSYQHHPPGHMMWPNSPSFNSIPAQHQQHMHGLPIRPTPMPNRELPLHGHHVGSAPAMNPSIWDSRHAYARDSAEGSAFHPGSLGSLGFSANSLLHHPELASHNIFPHSNGNHIDSAICSAHGIPSPQQRCPTFPGRNSMILVPGSSDVPNDRVRSRRSDANANQPDNKKQYELNIDRIVRGEDSRTTLMIKNIPNKYTSKMLLATIDEQHRGTYDFIYLPIDFKNKCNVGYAFINMTDPRRIIPFYQAFNGKKWEKFNSEKVASLAYARIQGKTALIAHFQNSSLMNEDKRCRPILFHSDGPNAGDQEPFPVGNNIRSRHGRSRASSNEENHQGSPSNCSNREETSNVSTEFSSSSSKDSE